MTPQTQLVANRPNPNYAQTPYRHVPAKSKNFRVEPKPTTRNSHKRNAKPTTSRPRRTRTEPKNPTLLPPASLQQRPDRLRRLPILTFLQLPAAHKPDRPTRIQHHHIRIIPALEPHPLLPRVGARINRSYMILLRRRHRLPHAALDKRLRHPTHAANHRQRIIRRPPLVLEILEEPLRPRHRQKRHLAFHIGGKRNGMPGQRLRLQFRKSIAGRKRGGCRKKHYDRKCHGYNQDIKQCMRPAFFGCG